MAAEGEAQATNDSEVELARNALAASAPGRAASGHDRSSFLDESEDEERCGQCCEDKCSKCCKCERTCLRCIAFCTGNGRRCLCCRCCCSRRRCSCCYRRRPSAEPVEVTWSYAAKQVVDDNVVLGCVLQFRPWPPVLERLLLMLLFLATAVFVEYAKQAIGPICVRQYLDQCPVYRARSSYLPPFQYIELGPPGIDIPEGTEIHHRRLEEAVVQGVSENVSSLEMAYARRLDTGVGKVATSDAEIGRAQSVRDSLLMRLSLIFGTWDFNCNKPMCDIFYPQMIDWLALWVLTNSIFGTSTSYDVPFTSQAILVGYCKCEGPLYNGIPSAQVSGEARSILITVMFQTLLPKVFQGLFACTRSKAGSTSSRSCCQAARSRCHKITVGAVLVIVGLMCLGIFLLKYDPEGWRNALLSSVLSTVFADPLVSLTQLVVCVRIGVAAPTERLMEVPWLWLRLSGRAEADLGEEPELEQPARIGRPLTPDAA